MRKILVLSVVAVILITASGIISAMQGWDTWSAVIGYLAFALVALMILSCTRYVSRVTTTSINKSRGDISSLGHDLSSLIDRPQKNLQNSLTRLSQQIETLEILVERTATLEEQSIKAFIAHEAASTRKSFDSQKNSVGDQLDEALRVSRTMLEQYKHTVTKSLHRTEEQLKLHLDMSSEISSEDDASDPDTQDVG